MPTLEEMVRAAMQDRAARLAAQEQSLYLEQQGKERAMVSQFWELLLSTFGGDVIDTLDPSVVVAGDDEEREPVAQFGFQDSGIFTIRREYFNPDYRWLIVTPSNTVTHIYDSDAYPGEALLCVIGEYWTDGSQPRR